LKRLPRTVEDSKKVAETIKLIRSKISTSEAYENDVLSLRLVTQEELRKNVDNLFVLIASSDIKLISLWQRIVKKAAGKFVRFAEYVDKRLISVSITPANSTYNFRTTFFFISQKSHAIKKHDLWIVERGDKNLVTAKHRFLGEEVAVPTKALTLGFRRSSGTGTIDISNSLDYMIKEAFPEIQRLIGQEIEAQKAVKNVKNWEKLVKRASLLLSRRYDLSATGTKHLAFYSSVPTFGIDM